MRIALKDRHEVAHYWANKVQAEGRAGNVFFHGDKIYSYGRHFVIARHLPEGVVVFSERGYSPSTGQHQSIVRQATGHLTPVYCHDADMDARSNMNYARMCIRNRLTDATEKPRIRQNTRDGLRADALRIAERANAYLSALPLDEQMYELPIDIASLETIREQMDAIDRERAAQRTIAESERVRKAQEHASEWRAGGNHVSLSSLPPMLRLHPDGKVETSWGAEIPVSHALHLWPLLGRVRKSGVEWHSPPEKTFHMGVYTLNTIKPDGSIIVGCHDIAYSEIEGIARALRLID